MAVIKLTKRTVDALGAEARAYVVYDADLKGFSVRVAASGTKTWQVEYRPYPGGRGVSKRRMALGSTQSLTPDEAKRKARDILSAAGKGEDPARDRVEKRLELRMIDLIDIYAEEGCVVQRGMRQGEPMKATTKAYTLARLRNHVVPLLGGKRITEVNATDIERMVRDIAKGATAKDEIKGPRQRIIVRGGEGAARKVARDLSAVFSFAVRRGLSPGNPIDKAAIRKTDNQRTRYLSINEVHRLGDALEQLEGEGVNPMALNICRLWALTGCRRDEIAGLEWSEIDFERACLKLADSKTGASVRPLAAPALALLSSLPRYGNGPFVFPASTGAGHYQGTKRIWPKVVEKAQLPGVTPQTLRHSLGSAAVSTGETLVMTGAILGHKNARSTSIYAHVQADPATQAVGRAVGPIAAALSRRNPFNELKLKSQDE